MLGYASKIASDFLGLSLVAGVGVGLRWLWAILTHFGAIRAKGNLQPADWALGPGPFNVSAAGSRATLVGEGVVSGIREAWVRHVYLGSPGFETFPDSGVFLDLGANMGNVTLMALGRGPNVRAVAVECNPGHIASLKRSLDVNGWTGRADIVNAFIGGFTPFQENERQHDASHVPTLSVDELLARYNITRIAYLKCDIEGSEFDLFKPGSKLLAITDRLGMEIHDHLGSRADMLKLLENEGFQVHLHRDDKVCCMIHARRIKKSGTTDEHR
jgi:FkbM family methyltransferase